MNRALLCNEQSPSSHWGRLKSQSKPPPYVRGKAACSSLSPWSHSISNSEDTSVNRWSQSQLTSSCRAEEETAGGGQESMGNEREQSAENREGEQEVLMYTS